MKTPIFEGMDKEVTRDLCKKVVLDIFETITRTLEIAPQPHAAIVTAAGSAAVGMLATLMQRQAGTPIHESGKPDDAALILAAMIIARYCIGGKKRNRIDEAIKDVDILMNAKRFP